jgi:uncharacterized membrane protein
VDWPQFVVQWLHVLLGILWFGYALSMYFLVSPALMQLPEHQGRITNSRLGAIGKRVFPVVAILVLLLGIVRGTVFGPINSLEDLFGTAYGWTWLVALVATLGLVFTGARATSARCSKGSRTPMTTPRRSRGCGGSRGSTSGSSPSSSPA